jgi:hypothetical protein
MTSTASAGPAAVIDPSSQLTDDGLRFPGVSEPRRPGGGSGAASVASGNHDVDARKLFSSLDYSLP